ncbi:MAG: DUF1761 domain-containing protein [Parcubacteria group bacterium]|nr:DUF1761 domain-containing protein [Parcubacteria group bacterium]
MPEISINFVAVVVAAVVYMGIGMLWYGPLFGKEWRRLIGFSEADMKKMTMTPVQAMVGGFIAALIMSFVLAHDAYVWGLFFGASVGSYLFAFQLAFWIWLGYIATTQLGAVLWEGRPWKLFCLNAANSLVSLIAMALVITFLK